MTTDLKLCPFCAGNAAIGGDDARYRVHCVICYAAAWGRDEAEAVTAWNRRTPDHSGEATNPPDPMTSVVTWTRYDGRKETLPPILKRVLVKDARHAMRFAVLNIWLVDDLVWDDVRGLEYAQIGDLWAYMPTPGEEVK